AGSGSQSRRKLLHGLGDETRAGARVDESRALYPRDGESVCRARSFGAGSLAPDPNGVVQPRGPQLCTAGHGDRLRFRGADRQAVSRRKRQRAAMDGHIADLSGRGAGRYDPAQHHAAQHQRQRRHRGMKWVLVAIIVFATVLADLLQSFEMKRAGEQSVSANGLGRLLRTIAERKLLFLGVMCNAVSFFGFMALVQREPLSFAVPASSASFVLETLLAKFVLHEKIGVRRAAGTAIVLVGVVLVGG